MKYTKHDVILLCIVVVGFIGYKIYSRYEANNRDFSEDIAMYDAKSDSLLAVFEAGYDAIVRDSTLSQYEKIEQKDQLAISYAQKSLQEAREVVRKNKKNALGLHVFVRDIAQNRCMTPDIYERELAEAGQYIAENQEVVNFTNYFQHLKRSAVGQPYVDLQFEGEKLSELLDSTKITLLTFYCLEAQRVFETMQAVNSVGKNYEDYVNVVNVNVYDQKDSVLNYISDITRNHWIFGATNDHLDQYAIEKLPFVLILSADGSILSRNVPRDKIEEIVVCELKKTHEPEN